MPKTMLKLNVKMVKRALIMSMFAFTYATVHASAQDPVHQTSAGESNADVNLSYVPNTSPQERPGRENKFIKIYNEMYRKPLGKLRGSLYAQYPVLSAPKYPQNLPQFPTTYPYQPNPQQSATLYTVYPYQQDPQQSATPYPVYPYQPNPAPYPVYDVNRNQHSVQDIHTIKTQQPELTQDLIERSEGTSPEDGRRTPDKTSPINSGSPEQIYEAILDKACDKLTDTEMNNSIKEKRKDIAKDISDGRTTLEKVKEEILEAIKYYEDITRYINMAYQSILNGTRHGLPTQLDGLTYINSLFALNTLEERKESVDSVLTYLTTYKDALSHDLAFIDTDTNEHGIYVNQDCTDTGQNDEEALSEEEDRPVPISPVPVLLEDNPTQETKTYASILRTNVDDVEKNRSNVEYKKKTPSTNCREGSNITSRKNIPGTREKRTVNTKRGTYYPCNEEDSDGFIRVRNKKYRGRRDKMNSQSYMGTKY